MLLKRPNFILIYLKKYKKYLLEYLYLSIVVTITKLYKF